MFTVGKFDLDFFNDEFSESKNKTLVRDYYVHFIPIFLSFYHISRISALYIF